MDRIKGERYCASHRRDVLERLDTVGYLEPDTGEDYSEPMPDVWDLIDAEGS